MVTHRIGCMGWSYPFWKGPFYAPGTPASDYLERYARVFNLVEIDSTFYQTPPSRYVDRWNRITPPGFRFTAKVPRTITHETHCANTAPLQGFLDVLNPLRIADKLGPILFQLPPSMHADEHAQLLDALDHVDTEDAIAVEPRHESWWDEDIYDALRTHSTHPSLVWSQNPYTTTPPVTTNRDWLYIRFLGDRDIEPEGRIQRDKRSDLEGMAQRVQELLPESDLETVYWLVNNHFMGYAPGTAKILADVLGLAAPDVSAAKRSRDQTSLDDVA